MEPKIVLHECIIVDVVNAIASIEEEVSLCGINVGVHVPAIKSVKIRANDISRG